MKKKIDWATAVEKKIKAFANEHALVYRRSARELSASFEIGCFHALLNYYDDSGYTLKVEQPGMSGEYRYLTTPNGNPSNFSYIHISGPDGEYEIRQQVRIYSYLNKDIAFAPDIVVLQKDATIKKKKDADYASGKRPFYTVSSKFVVAAHECKSMVPFPELLISFVGMFIAAHKWYAKSGKKHLDASGDHIAPTLFVGGTARGMHLRMIQALETVFPINIIVGMHSGTWNFHKGRSSMNLLKFNKAAVTPAISKASTAAAAEMDIPF